MAQMPTVIKLSDEVKAQSIETLKVRQDKMEYLRKNRFKTIDDIVRKQNKIPKKYKGDIFVYLIFEMNR